MDFNFLPHLPKSDLDDRTFQDLVDECLLRIPRYCPEWTHHNPSDPGITLIELFAWLTDQMLLRFNQVPRRNYITFLETLGIRLQAPVPARVDVTFYLSAPLSAPYTIPRQTEVATLRTETEDAIVFCTDRPLEMGKPQIRHCLAADQVQESPQQLRDLFATAWSFTSDEEWLGPELSIFRPQPQPGNCFYLVFEPSSTLQGNVITLTVKGAAATPTGINPDAPPRYWQAWTGDTWEPVLMAETDDLTNGFSFAQVARSGGNPRQGAQIMLHCPQSWPLTTFGHYQGHWLRCSYIPPSPQQPGYTHSPRIVGLHVQTVGGTVSTTQSSIIRDEVLGKSDGTSGQTFQLQSPPVLPREDPEHLIVTPVGGVPQIWQEVNDFANSGPEDLHYTLDSISGTLQLGPLIREPTQLSTATHWRSRQQAEGIVDPHAPAPVANAAPRNGLQRQYGKIPSRGAELRMAAYRMGGGQQGNVQPGAIQIVKSAVPYVARVGNLKLARYGANAESLDAAVLRVPQLLRTRDRAVTAEDFEALALAGSNGTIARAKCLSAQSADTAGIVRLLLVPQAAPDPIEQGQGLPPDQFQLTPQLIEQVRHYLDQRRLLGVQVHYDQPRYVGVAVQAEVALDPEFNTPNAQTQILETLTISLYRFLNPVTGGTEGQGWPFGRPVYPSDIITLFQTVPQVRYIGAIKLFELRPRESGWQRTLPREPMVDPGPLGLLCSWRDDQLRSSHAISLL